MKCHWVLQEINFGYVSIQSKRLFWGIPHSKHDWEEEVEGGETNTQSGIKAEIPQS